MLSLHENYIIDEKGHKTAVILPFEEWKKVCDLLEEFEEICAYDQAKSEGSDPISVEDFKKELNKE